ncbi:hypothetical protein E2C01_086714 [Portunus trituberculatus]|uniref:Uncharacterized protein n=1 Tax=Portunus trituberculatus TaxID=210409 RepID=A0A5B7J655_PORTR|nr:hypothetical protein [Portunus trituberculatus]
MLSVSYHQDGQPVSCGPPQSQRGCPSLGGWLVPPLLSTLREKCVGPQGPRQQSLPQHPHPQMPGVSQEAEKQEVGPSPHQSHLSGAGRGGTV